MIRFDDPLARERRRWMRPNADLYVRPDAYRWMSPASPRLFGKDAVGYFWPEPTRTEPTSIPEYKYNPDQPRVPAGNPDGGQRVSADTIQVAGTVIRICLAGSRSLITDSWGNKSYWIEYNCLRGRTFTLRGSGHDIRAIVLDPFQ